MKLPKKLDIMDLLDLKEEYLFEQLFYKVNDLIDYLSEKEATKTYKYASSVCCDSSFRMDGNTLKYHVCNKCNKPCDIDLKEKEASKGEIPKKMIIHKRNGDVDIELEDGKYSLVADATIQDGQLKYLDNGQWSPKLNPPQQEESRGECKVMCRECRPPKPINDHKYFNGTIIHERTDCPPDTLYMVNENLLDKPQLKEESPKEDEREQWQCDLAILMGKMVGRRGADFDEPLEDFIKERFVSKVKIKRCACKECVKVLL